MSDERWRELRQAGIGDRSPEMGDMLETSPDQMAARDDTTGGDLDANLEQAKVVGDEAVGGTASTLDQGWVEQHETQRLPRCCWVMLCFP